MISKFFVDGLWKTFSWQLKALKHRRLLLSICNASASCASNCFRAILYVREQSYNLRLIACRLIYSTCNVHENFESTVQLFGLSHCQCNLCIGCARKHFRTSMQEKGVTGLTCPNCDMLNPANVDDLHHAFFIYTNSVCF